MLWLLAAIFLFAFGHPWAGVICLCLLLIDAAGVICLCLLLIDAAG
jgi:hypothetical protein